MKRMTEKKKRRKLTLLGEVVDTLITFGITFIVMYVVVTYLFTPVRVLGNSMFPELHDGDFGFANTVGRNVFGVDHGDVVIVYLEDRNTYLIKRIIGLPGDTVRMEDHTLYVNDIAVEEDYLDEAYIAECGEDEFFADIEEIRLGDNEYYVLGDNRVNSRDSRVYGPFSKDQIRAKDVFVIWPLSHAGLKK